MHYRFHTVHAGRQSAEQGFADLIAAKQRAAAARQTHGRAVESASEVFDAVCLRLGRGVEENGYRYSTSGHKSTKRLSDFSFDLRFTSDLNNVAGEHVMLRISGFVRSRRFKEWQKATGLSNPNDVVAGSQIGYFCSDHLDLVWELADPELRAAVTDGALQAIRELAFPWFGLFSDIRSLCARLIDGTVPTIDIIKALDFLMCFASRDDAVTAGRAFLARRPELSASYRQEFMLIRDRAPLRIHGQGFAKDLAILSHFFDLGDLS